jgi:nucleoside-diphosphate-sugar epimerase
MDHVFIAGCGDIGRRVARLWADRGTRVLALARSEESAARLAAQGVAPVRGDLDRGSTLLSLPTARALVYYFAPPPDEGGTDPRMRAFLSRIPAGQEPERLVYMSSSGVYGNCRGAWVTEETPARPETVRGGRRLDAETVALAWGRERDVPVIVLRVSGIYGPGRLPVDHIRKGLPVIREEEASYTNRIHADDLARVCVSAALRGRPGGIYNVSDGRPGTVTEYYNAVADLMGLPRPPAIGLDEARRVLSPIMLSFLRESKRLDNRRMREELGVELVYPTLEGGLRASLRESG